VNRQGGKTADAQLKCSSLDTCWRNHQVSSSMSSQLTAKPHPRPLWICGGNDPSARLIHRLSRMAREIGLLRSDEQMSGTVTRVPVARVAARLGGRCCGTWSGRRTPLPAADHAERAIDHGESRTSASRLTLREIYANRIPCPTRPAAGSSTPHRRRPSRRTAATLTRPGQAEGPGEPGTGATHVGRPGASRSGEFCNLPGISATPEGPGR
jgi:hypothetical protein